MANILLNECLEALKEDVEVIPPSTGDSISMRLQDLYTFVGLKEPWAWIPSAVILRTLDDLPPDILQSKCYILVSGGDVPILRTRMDLIANHFDDVSALDFEKYFFDVEGTWMVGVYSDDSMAYVRWEDWMIAVQARQEATLALVASRMSDTNTSPGIPITQLVSKKRTLIGHSPYIHPDAVKDYRLIFDERLSYGTFQAAAWEEEFGKAVFKLAARPSRYPALQALPMVYRCDDLRFHPIFYRVSEADMRVEILAVLERRWE
jgi:hypothetical protein